MILTLCIFGATVICTVCSVLFKPYIKIGGMRVGLYYIITLLGAAVILSTGSLPLSFAIKGITADTSVNPIKILTLFLSVSLVSLYLGNAGFFDYIAERVFTRAKNGGIKLFIVLFTVVSLLTAFTSNDIVILTFTPPVCIFCKKAKISPVPYLFGEFVAANVWSMSLIIGNPTNLYLAGSYGIGFFEYIKVALLPTALAGITALTVLLILFRKTLSQKVDSYTETDDNYNRRKTIPLDKPLAVISLIHLSASLVLLALSEFIGVETYLICLLCALSLTFFYSLTCVIKERSLKRVLYVFAAAPYELIPFVLSMFVIVLSLSYCGFTDKLSAALITGENLDGVSIGFLSAACANLLNNIPMSVLFEKIIAGRSTAALYGAIIGSNLGAFITPVGALAGIMWSKINVEYGVKFSFLRFFIYGIAVALPTLAVSTLTLLLTL